MKWSWLTALGFAGNLLGGKAADRSVMKSMVIILVALAGILTAFVFTAHSMPLAAITIVLFGAAGFATVPPLQMRVMQTAEGAPALASAANISAFNLGNASGAWLGGLAIERGLGYTAPNWIGALLAIGGLAVALISIALEKCVSSGTAGKASEARQNDRKIVPVAN